MIRQALFALLIIGLTIGVLALVSADRASDVLPFLPLTGLAIAVGVGIDARRIQLWDHETGFGRRPWVLVVLAALGWVVVLPWYLTVRERVRAGQIPRRARSD